MGFVRDIVERRRRARIRKQLEATMKPDPTYRARRLRYLADDPIRQRRFDLATRDIGT